jgi:hypothetical protein
MGFTTIITTGQTKELVTVINNLVNGLTSSHQDWEIQTHADEAVLMAYLSQNGIDYTKTHKKVFVKL